MIKIGIMSDLNLQLDAAYNEEHRGSSGTNSPLYAKPVQPKADFLILAGNTHSGSLGIDWVRNHFAIPVIVILGNHEAYGRELFRAIAVNRERAGATQGRVVCLERAIWQFEAAPGERLRLLGATLWTDFRLDGTPAESMAIAQQQLEDFRAIRVERGYRLRALDPSDTARLHDTTRAFLVRELRRPFDGATVVATHHAPSARSIARRSRGDPLNPAVASDLEALIRAYQPSLWIHGHVHHSLDYRIGATRVVCNPRGYFPSELNPAFDPSLVVEVD